MENFPLPPKVEIEPLSTDPVGDAPYQLLVTTEDQGGGIKDVRFYHNGKIVDVGAILEQKDAEAGGTVENFYAVTSFQKRFLTQGLRNSGIQILTATRRDQLAPESAELGAGFLTYLVDQALQGKGDIDPRDGWISSQEVAKFTYQALPELFLAQREKNPKAFSRVYGADVQEPDVYSIGADLMIARTAP